MTAGSGVADVMSRISEIQNRFGVAAPTTGGQATSGQAFGQILAATTGDASMNGGYSAAAAGGVSGDDVVQDASQYLGVPYQWGGTDPSSGLDCSGLVQRAYKDLGIDLPRVAADQARMGQPVASLADAKPGDLVAFGSPVDHIGIYAGNNKMVVAPHTGDVVKIQDITRTPTAIRRIVGSDVAGASRPSYDPMAMRLALSQSAASIGDTSDMTDATSAAGATGVSSLSPSTPYSQLFQAAGARYGVDPSLLAAVARAESGYNPAATSGAGAVGLMQIMPATAKSLGIDPRDPAQAVDGAARILAGNIQKYGSVPLAVAAYNAGGGAVDRYGGIPPYSETQAYVRRVLSYAGGTSS